MAGTKKVFMMTLFCDSVPWGTITDGHSPEFLSDLHIKTKKGYIKNKEEHHCCQVYDPTDKSFAVEVEANLVTRMF